MESVEGRTELLQALRVAAGDAPSPEVPTPVETPSVASPEPADLPGSPAEPVCSNTTKTKQPASHNATGTIGDVAPSGSAPIDRRAAKSVAAAVKVDSDRLDSLIDLIGELVISESMLREDVTARLEQIDSECALLPHHNKIIRELQELSLSLRMVAINGLFQKMSRLVRDLSRKLDKPVDLELEGAATELDKTVVDQVADPLMHIVRNAIDHGIEGSTAEREAHGKDHRGRVVLRAFHQGGSVFIEVEDDGKGLDRDKLIARAIERGIITSDAQLTDAEAFALIFEPGFSTAEAVTDVSGRGVGMDVVRRNIEALRGSVEIRSTPGKGSVFSLRLPLTLAIIDGMVVRAGGSRFILSTARIVESICPTEEQLATVTGRGRMLAVRDQHVPWFELAEVLDIETEDTASAEQTGSEEINADQRVIVLVDDRDRIAGLMVDEIVGRQQVVIKSLDESLPGLSTFAGGAVMPDGQVGLIVDIEGVLNKARGKQLQ